jgi:hypothetical protein
MGREHLQNVDLSWGHEPFRPPGQGVHLVVGVRLSCGEARRLNQAMRFDSLTDGIAFPLLGGRVRVRGTRRNQPERSDESHSLPSQSPRDQSLVTSPPTNGGVFERTVGGLRPRTRSAKQTRTPWAFTRVFDPRVIIAANAARPSRGDRLEIEPGARVPLR